ncbi:hypothetical protein PIB30_048866 [Stylosanthes scabra]|uniref:Uncharacterized protein n=1 Tax=Stylosanthes scabra TaxID=79078 RepID=A0ABU6YHN2_9FABA|nr:hypothetical protein [Stylosanthes scabra]
MLIIFVLFCNLHFETRGKEQEKLQTELKKLQKLKEFKPTMVWLAASVPSTEIVGKSDYFRFGMRDSLLIEAAFLQAFYYFIKSENNPKADPLMVWLTGCPGCPAFSGLAFEIGL